MDYRTFDVFPDSVRVVATARVPIRFETYVVAVVNEVLGQEPLDDQVLIILDELPECDEPGKAEGGTYKPLNGPDAWPERWAHLCRTLLPFMPKHLVMVWGLGQGIEDPHFVWILAHELRHLSQHLAHDGIAHAIRLLRDLRHQLPGVPYYRLAHEMDAELTAWRVCRTVLTPGVADRLGTALWAKDDHGIDLGIALRWVEHPPGLLTEVESQLRMCIQAGADPDCEVSSQLEWIQYLQVEL